MLTAKLQTLASARDAAHIKSNSPSVSPVDQQVADQEYLDLGGQMRVLKEDIAQVQTMGTPQVFCPPMHQ